MNSDLTYLASKCLNLTSKNRSKSCTCRSVSLSVQYLMQSYNWINFGHFFHFFFKFLTKHIKKEWQNVKVFWPPQLKNLNFVMLWPLLQCSISNCVLCYDQCQLNIALRQKKKLRKTQKALFLPYLQYLRQFFVEKKLTLPWKWSKIGLNKIM